MKDAMRQFILKGYFNFLCAGLVTSAAVLSAVTEHWFAFSAQIAMAALNLGYAAYFHQQNRSQEVQS